MSDVNENQNVIKTTVFGDIEPSPVSAFFKNRILKEALDTFVRPVYDIIISDVLNKNEQEIFSLKNLIKYSYNATVRGLANLFIPNSFKPVFRGFFSGLYHAII